MKLGLHLGYWGAKASDPLPLAVEAERLGFDSVWSAEAWGSDSVTIAAWVAARTSRIGIGTAVMQIPARTPAAAAMTAITLDHLSGGRFRLGLGMSGPQVVEGWHGSPYGNPLRRTREYVEIVRAVLRREEPVEHHGEHYDMPVTYGGTGLGKPLKTIVHPLRADLPVYLAAIGPRNVALAAEIADGWLPMLYSPFHAEVFEASVERGFARAGRGGDGFDVAPMAYVAVGDDVSECHDRLRPLVALYVGGMGARGSNFYNDLVTRYGYEAEAILIQELFLDGKHREAAAAVPDTLVDDVALVGPAARIRDRMAAWREAGVTTLIAWTDDPTVLRILAEANR